jgi:hypothetical protein
MDFKFSQCRFERIGPALRNVGVEGPLIPRHCLGQGTRVCLWAMVISFPPAFRS